MAFRHHGIKLRRETVLVICLSAIVQSQNYPNQYYGPQNPYLDQSYHVPNPGDKDYRTYVYNSRRYGQNQPHMYPGYPGNPNLAGQDPRFRYDREGNEEPILPGILAGWRSDLQGKERSDSRIKDRDVFVKTSHGQVQGFKVYLYDNPDPQSLYRPGTEFVEREQGVTSVFLGIPYAQPPIAEGRFRPPRWHKGWQNIQAVDFGPACPQPTIYTGVKNGIRDMHEDCLYLNIYTPTTEIASMKYPVMVYIHGGDFMRGASNLFPGHIMATFYKVVVVTFNYRLGALGFLSTGDINSPGNYGVLDQAMALKWIHENIDNFNGDRNSITLFGPGAGAASAGLLMVNPDTKHIVNQVIAQSGSALADWAFINDKYRVQNTSRVFGQIMGCSIESSWKLVNCLKHSRSALELGNTEFPPHVGLFPWAPVIEMNFSMPYYEGWHEKQWHFLQDPPENLVRKGEFNKGLKYMSSVTMQEAAYFIYNNNSLAPDYVVNQEFFDQKVWELVRRYNYTLNMNGTYEAIKYMYTYWPDPTNVTHIREKYVELLSDFLYVAPNDKMIKLLVEQDIPVYMYVLNTTVESFNTDFWRKTPHNIEHYLLCGAPFMDVEFFPESLKFKRDQWTNNDRNMSHFFMKAYTDFAKYGTPSYTRILGLHFEMAQNGMLKYLNLNTTYNSTIKWNYRQTESAFWTMYLPTVVGHLVPTYPPTTEFWWEPRTPLQVAFWSMATMCLLLVVLVVVCCMLWRNAKRQSDRYYNNTYMNQVDEDLSIANTRSPGFEYTDKTKTSVKSGSVASLHTNSQISLKELQEYSEQKKATPLLPKQDKHRTYLPEGVPQTDV